MTRLGEPLEGAAGLCLSRTNYNVEVEHWLMKLLEASDTDLSKLLRHYEVDPSRLNRELTKAIDRLKTGNSRPPSLSPMIVDLVKHAWVLASIEYGVPAIRSGHLLVALLVQDDLARLARHRRNWRRSVPKRSNASSAIFRPVRAKTRRRHWPAAARPGRSERAEFREARHRRSTNSRST